jgi:hypothetical protein
MRNTTLRIVLIIMALALLVAGCRPTPQEQPAPAGVADAAPAAAQPTVAAAAAQPTAATAASADDEELDFGAVAGLAQFNSYRMTMQMTWDYADGDKGDMQIVSEFVRNPPASRMVWSGKNPSGFGDEDLEMEMIQVEGTTYMKFGGTWMAISSDDTPKDDMGWWGDPEDMFGRGRGQYMGQETINGMPARHYRYEEQDLYLGLSASNTTLAQADVWVSTEHNIYVKYVVRWEGVEEDHGQGWLNIESYLTDINAPITIEPPSGVDAPGVPDDVPMIDGASEVNLLGGMVTYKTNMSAEDATTFYKDGMASEGWSLDSDMGVGMLTFSKGTRSATIMISDEDGMTSVIIIINE